MTALLIGGLLFIPLVWSFQFRSQPFGASATPHPATPPEPRPEARPLKILGTSADASIVRHEHIATSIPLAAVPSVQRTPLGALQATGEVLVNNAPVEREGTVFIGDTVRTGANGAASITIAGRGRLILAARTEVALSGAARYLVSLEVGTLGLNALADAQNFQVRVGNFLVVPSPESDATAEIERAADGSARISCMAGSVGVIALEGEDVVFLRAGQSGRISAEGVFSMSKPSTPAPAPEQPQPRVKRRVPVGVIVLIVAGGGAAGAAAALAGKKDNAQPLSPSQP